MTDEFLTQENFTGKEGSTYEVFNSSGELLFKMELIEVRKGLETKVPKWKADTIKRTQQFSIFFESDRKALVRKDTFVKGPGFDNFPLKIEPIDETAKGYIYQACFA